MKRTALALTLIIALFVLLVIGGQSAKSTPKTITVPDDYPTIQVAIENASAGDTVFVRKGTYEENIVIDKTLSLMGEDSRETVIKGRYSRYGSSDTIEITAENVAISGFTITDNVVGIAARGSGCRIIGNNIEDNFDTGILIEYSKNNVISGNNISGNRGGGIDSRSNSTIISDNNIMGNWRSIDSGAGVTVSGVDVTVRNNNISNNSKGLEIRDTEALGVYGNDITENQVCGVWFTGFGSESSVHHNNIKRNTIGIYIRNVFRTDKKTSAFGYRVYDNNLIDNFEFSYLHLPQNASALFSANPQNAFIEPNPVIGNERIVVSWDNGVEGNYWSDYRGQGTYVIDENNIDHHPLLQPVDISAASSPLTIIVVLVAAVILVIACVGLLAYFRKRRGGRNP